MNTVKEKEEWVNSIEPTVLYEDQNMVAINKPAGLVVHSDGKTKENTLADWVLEKYPETENVGESIETKDGIIKRPGIVHRLDRETSGVMLVAKNNEAFLNLKEQFQNHQISKKYEAFVYGNVKNDEGVIDRPIGRSKSDFRKWSAQRGARGEMREAVTEYKVLKRSNDYTLIEALPKTGRTHQIRVHLKAINYPIVGDALYASKKENTLGFDRVALHSKEIRFKDLGGKEHTVIAPYPKDFSKALYLLQN